jgi:penicillin amidase
LTGLEPPPAEGASSSKSTSFRLASVLERPRGILPGASNAWVVSGDHSASGRPLLAADPHLGLAMPSIFYELHLAGGALDVSGASIPGLPLVVFGQNQRIAWGITALFADVQDVYLETVNPQNPRQYAWGGQWVDLDIVPESIPVKDAAAVTEEVRVTRHGVVVGETTDGRLLAQRWDAIWNGDHVSVLLELNRAGSWEEFTEALRGWSSPALAFVYADVEGNIGFFPAGDIPVRVTFDGAVPVDGSSGEYEWEGIVSHDLKPMLFNPENGSIVSANHGMLPADAPYPLGVDTLADFRARRITDLLEASLSLSLDDFARIQDDRYDVSTEPILRHIVALRPEEDEAASALETLRDWNGRMDSGPAPAIYYAIYVELLANTFRDELGDDLFNDYLDFLELGHPGGLHAIVDDETSPFWDDRTTPEVESRAQIFARSLESALTSLSARFGSDVSQWDWGQVHGVHFRHPMGREQPLSWLLSRGPVPFGGSTNTIANAVVSLREPFDTSIGTSFRFLADLSDLRRSRTSVPTGASGHPLSPHYFDQNPGWLSGESHLLLGGASSGRLVLQP